MRTRSVTFRLDAQKAEALDAIAAGIDRDRSYVLNEAVRSYIDTYRWQVEHIQEGLRQADAGKFASDAEAASAFSKWRKAKSR